MIAIINTEIEAYLLADKIHEYLFYNRKDYKGQTVRWQDINKSDSDELWAVAIPEDYPHVGETVSNYPEGWEIIEDIDS